MEFNDNKPIYRQIEDYAFNCIIDGRWLPGELVPSVREMSAALAVNSRTVLKAYDELQAFEIISPRRGMGFELAHDALSKVTQLRKNEFFNVTLPALVEEMKRLGIDTQQIINFLNGK